ncbi:filamentous hemagglutinin N-terminal domain-containing protein [Paraburkholderia sp.]|uniref:filamentous hemagglutinin N-terminal domain-containing protein n=1 Tax=Paraburkholderia sp. TaxID=1926495 RepID=UPI0025E9C034|nr:filamentous hemagglutinin N-terminal domain-containing protein [Paraburkholderia sp.]
MNTSKRELARRLERAHALRDEFRSRQRTPVWLTLHRPLRSYRVWQRALAALVAVTLFTGPLTVTFEQGESAAGVLAAGSRRLDDEAWQVMRDLASVRVSFAMELAHATPIVDPTAPISFQPKVTQSTGAGGGVPVVNITAPNAAGISLNQYQSFNIDPVGLILNNSLMAGTSLTGGNVQANPNLAGRAAGVIVNQVTSTGTANASLLNGPLEVFGAPATVIIANPNGITTQGTSFTNTIGVTLTTGTPQFLDGVGGAPTGFAGAQAIGFNVTGGHIQIEGDPGVNGPGAGIEGTVGSIDLIGETIGVNAPLYAGTRINAIAGDQFAMPSRLDATGTTYATSSNGTANTAAAINAANGSANNGLAIDATAFGAMTAGQIQVVATAAGMGVRSDAQLAANVGDLTLSANGDVTVAGSAAQQQASVSSGGNVSFTGMHIGVGGYSISANGDVTSTGSIQSGANLSINAGGNINVADTQSAGDTTMVASSNVSTGSVQSGGALSLTAQGNDGTGDVTLAGPTVVTGATTLAAVRDINVNAALSSGTLQAGAGRDVNVNAAIQGAGDIALSAANGNLTTGASVNSGGNLALSSGLATTIANQATAQGTVTVNAGQGIAVSGSLASGTSLAATTQGVLSVTGSMLVGTDVSVNAAGIDVPGVLIAQNNGTLNAGVDITSSGSMAFGQNGTLTAGHDVSLTGQLLANGLQVSAANSVTLADVQAGGAFAVMASGSAGNGNVTFNGNAAVVGATGVQAAGDVIVNGTLAGGAQVALAAQGNVTVAATATVQSVGDLSLAAANGSVTSTGTLASAGKLSANAAQDVALTGSTSAAGDMTLTTGNDLTLGGTVAGQGNATLTAGHDVNLGGTSGFTIDANVTSGHDIVMTGALQANNVTLNAGNSATLQDVQANAALAVIANGAAGGGDITVNGTVASLTTGALNAAHSVSVNGTLQTASTLDVTAEADTTVAGTVQSNGDMTLTNQAGSLTSTGQIASGGKLTINAAQSVDLGTSATPATTSVLGDLSVNAGQNLTLNGTVVGQGNGTLVAGGAISGAASIAFGLAASLTSGSDTTLTGSLRGATIQTNAGGSGTFADVQAGSTIALAANNDLNLTGTLAGGSSVTFTAGHDINVSGSLQSASDTSLTARAGNVGVTGTINSNGALNVLAGTDINLGGTTTVALDTTLEGGRDTNVTGTVNGQGNGFVIAGRNIGGAGTLAFAQSAVLNAAANIDQAGLVQGQTVRVSASGDAALNNVESATTLALAAGTSGSGSLSVNGAAAAAGAITATAYGDVTVAATGQLAAGTTVGVAALNSINVAGAIESNSDAVLNAQLGSLNATGGINSGGNLTITTGQDLSLGASTSAVGDVTLTAGGSIGLNGVLVGTNGYVSAGQDIGGPGTQAFSGAALLAAQGSIALAGTLEANVVQAGGGDNAALNNVVSNTTIALVANGNAGNGDASVTGTATAQGAITVTAARDVLVSGTLGSGDAVTLTAQRNVSATGGVQSVGDLDVTATGGTATLGGTTATLAALNVVSGLDTRLGGQIAAQGNVNVQAGTGIELDGTLAGQMAGTFAAGQDISGAGSAAFAQTAVLTAAHDLALTGALQATGVTVTAGNTAGLGSVQAVSGDLDVTAQGNAGGGDVTFTGTAIAAGNVNLVAARDVSAGGAIGSGGTTTVTAARNMTLAEVNSTGDLVLNATGGIVTGNATTNGNLTVSAGNSLAMGSALASGTVSLAASGHDGTGDVTLAAELGSGGVMAVTAARDITVGAGVQSGDALALSATRSLGVGGNLVANGNAALVATNGNLSVGGTTVAVGSLAANAGGALALNGGLVNGVTTLGAGGAMTLTGALYGLGAATITVGGSIDGGGALTFGQDINVSSGGSVVLGGVQGAGQLTANSVGDMSFGATTTVGNVSATSTLGSVSFNGALTSGGNVQIQAANGAAVTGGIASMGTVNVTGTNGNVTVGGVSSNGDATLTAGQTLTLNGSSTVAGEFTLAGGNVTVSGTQAGSKDIAATAQGTLDAGQASFISTGNLQLAGADVVVGSALVGGVLNVQASDHIATAAGGQVDVVGAASFTAQNGFTNAASVLAGGNLLVSAANVTNTATGSLVSTATTTIDGTNFANAGLVNGTDTVVNLAGSLTNAGGALMGLNTLTISTASLNNQNGLLFAGNSSGTTTAAGNLSLAITGGAGSFSDTGGQILAQGNLTINAPNTSVDMSQGTISQAGLLSLTVGTLDVAGTWNYGGTGVTVDALNGMTNNGTITGTTPFTVTTGGIFTNNGQVIGNDVTFTGSLINQAGALLHASDTLSITGDTINRGTVEAGNVLNVSGGNYDNQGATTQSQGDVNFNLGGVLQNTGGSIFAGNNINISAGAVVNDQTAPSSATATTTISDPSLLLSGVIGSETEYWEKASRGDEDFHDYTTTLTATLQSLPGVDGTSGSAIGFVVDTNGRWLPVAATSYGVQATIGLPTVYETITTEVSGKAGIISAGNSIQLVTNSLSNQGGEIAAAGSISLNIGSLSNGATAPTLTATTTQYVNQSDYTAFLNQLKSLGVIEGVAADTICVLTQSCQTNGTYYTSPPTISINTSEPAPSAISSITTFGPTGMIAAGDNISISSGGSLVNAGLIYAGNNVIVQSGILTNQGGNSQNYSSSVGCASGVPNSACGNGGSPRGNNPNTTTFSYSQNDATIYAGNDLVIAAGQVDNTFGNLLAGHDIVIGGVGTTATSTTPAQSLNNTSGNIVAGNDITLNVSGAITNNLPPPVPVHQNYGTKQEYAGCMTAGGYKESYCEAYVDQQSGSSSVISAGSNLQITAGSLTNIGSLISAGTSATINVAGPVVNEAQTLNAYWHSEWVQETGMFSSDIRHNTWACGSPAECTALYGNAYTRVGGAIDPPTPVGNIAATIQAPNLTISSGGQIQNVGNVVGTTVSLTGQSLINGITTANTYTPLVNAPSQVISLSPVNQPGLNLSTPRSVGTPLPTAVAGTASYVDGVLGSTHTARLGPQQLIDNLPASLQPGSTLFYYNPQEENLLLQQAALAQTGKASFVSGLSPDSTTGLSVADQEKAVLYGNAVNYAEQNNIQLGTALTQTQINALTAPMLWYVEQTVPDPECKATGTATCPTITALMPQVYLPANSSALSAGGNIEASSSLTLDFGSAATGGSITNTGNITSGGSLTVNTGTLTNEANQVNVGQIWNSVKGGYTDTTGTVVQPGGFMSAADMSLNVATLQQIGGALQELGSNGSVDQAGTQQLIAQLQQQLGSDFTQTSVSDNLHTGFTKQGGGLPTFMVMAIALAASIVTAGAAAAAMGATLATMTLGESIVVGAVSGMAGSAASQLASGNGLDLGAILEAGAVGAITAGLTNGITYNSTTGELGIGNLDQGLNSLPQNVSTLGQLAGLGNLGNTLGQVAQAGSGAASALQGELVALGATATINAGVTTAIEGGSFLNNLESVGTSDLAAVGANFIGSEQSSVTQGLTQDLGPGLGQAAGELAYLAEHAALGCAASSAEGTGCTGGAIGGAVSAAATPYIGAAIVGSDGAASPDQGAAIAGISMLLSGAAAGALGQNVTGAATSAENEALNNCNLHDCWQKVVDAWNSASSTATNALNSAGSDVAAWIASPAGMTTLAMMSTNADIGGVAGEEGGAIEGAEGAFAAEETSLLTNAATATGSATEGTALFRGTTDGYPGSPGLQQIGITPTSTSPVIATVFATGSGTAYGNGVLQIALPSDLAGIEVSSLGNASTPSLAQIENEFAVSVAPTQFANLASTTITASQARSILSGMGINIPNTITLQGSELTEYLSTLPTMSQAQISTFLQKAAQIASGK